MRQKERYTALKRNKRTVPATASARPQGIEELVAQARLHFELRDFATAQKLCKDVLSEAPSHVVSLNLMGLMAQDSGRHAKAVKFFGKAIGADPDNAPCHYNIGSSYEALNERDKAAAHFKEAIALGMSRGEVDNHLVMQGAAIGVGLERIKAAWPRRPSAAELFRVPSIASDVLFCCGLETVRLSGFVAEKLLTEARYALLRLAADTALGFGGIEPEILSFCSALAQQCFINEYVYAQSDEEVRQVAALRDLLQDKDRKSTRLNSSH